MKIKITPKLTKQIIIGILFAGVMAYFLTLTDTETLIKDIAKQAWIFFAMLFIKFGEENVWRPMIVSASVVDSDDDAKKDTSADDSKKDDD